MGVCPHSLVWSRFPLAQRHAEFLSPARPRPLHSILLLILPTFPRQLLLQTTPAGVLPLPFPSGRFNHFAAWIQPHTLVRSFVREFPVCSWDRISEQHPQFECPVHSTVH